MGYIRKKYGAAVKAEIALEVGLCPIIPVKKKVDGLYGKVHFIENFTERRPSTY